MKIHRCKESRGLTKSRVSCISIRSPIYRFCTRIPFLPLGLLRPPVCHRASSDIVASTIPIFGRSWSRERHRKSLCMAHGDALWRVFLHDYDRGWVEEGRERTAYQPRPSAVAERRVPSRFGEEIRGKPGRSRNLVSRLSLRSSLLVFPKSISVGAGPRPVSSTRWEYDFEREGRTGGCRGGERRDKRGGRKGRKEERKRERQRGCERGREKERERASLI